MVNAQIMLNGVSKEFQQGAQLINVLNNIDIHFMQGYSYAITGISGSGKSTLMHIIAGIDIPTNGTVLFNTIPLNSCSAIDQAYHLNKTVGLVFQSSYIIPELSVIENIMLPALITGTSHTQLKHKALALLNDVGLANTQNHMPKSLSGGQQQRLALARALINSPAFLIADEPTGNLDIETGTTIIDLMLDCQKKWGMGIIISSHDKYVVQQMNEAYELVHGSLIKQ